MTASSSPPNTATRPDDRRVAPCRSGRLADAARKEPTAADRKLGRYRALLEAGTDPATVVGWIREAEIEKIAINLVKVLGQAAPADKVKICKELGLRLD
jgi:hypothetical protein